MGKKGFILIVIGIAFLIWRRDPPASPETPQKESSAIISDVEPPLSHEEQAKLPPGDILLHNYGTTASSPIEDVHKIGRVLENFFLIYKTLDSFHASTNSDFSRLLRGKNPGQEVYISASHRIYNEEGLLCDRWQTPFFFHPLSQGKVEIRSAGPDRKIFTSDDIHRDPSGMIFNSSQAQKSSLYPPAKNR